LQLCFAAGGGDADDDDDEDADEDDESSPDDNEPCSPTSYRTAANRRHSASTDDLLTKFCVTFAAPAPATSGADVLADDSWYP
jgi:hypothetical protein